MPAIHASGGVVFAAEPVRSVPREEPRPAPLIPTGEVVAAACSATSEGVDFDIHDRAVQRRTLQQAAALISIRHPHHHYSVVDRRP